MLVEPSVMEQRYQAVVAITQVGLESYRGGRTDGISRQTVHNWLIRQA